MDESGRARPDRARRDRFEALTTPHMAILFRGALRLCGQDDEAGDLVQETFLRAYRAFDNFSEGTNARAWLFTIMYSIFVNTYRARQRRPPIESIERLEERSHGAFDIPDWDAHDRIVDDAARSWGSEIGRALATLPEPFRAVVVAVDVKGLSYEEAASAIGCKIGTVRSRLFRGRRALATLLQDLGRQRGYVRGSMGEEKP